MISTKGRSVDEDVGDKEGRDDGEGEASELSEVEPRDGAVV